MLKPVVFWGVGTAPGCLASAFALGCMCVCVSRKVQAYMQAEGMPKTMGVTLSPHLCVYV